MKKIIFILVQIFSGILLAGNPNHINHSKPILVQEYQIGQSNSIHLKTDFGESRILNPEELSKINGQSIYQVDLIYTKYKTKQRFDQKQLNQDRIKALKKLSPIFNNAQIKWTLIEQTGQIEAYDAKKTNHGFVVHYGSDLSYSELNSFFGAYQKEFKTFELDNSTSNEINYKSGTTIKIPAKAVTYKNGKPVEGNYELKYREFRDPAEITFSGIPMVYNEKGSDYNFNSVGMLEIRAEKNGEALALKKDITYNFNCTDKKPGVNFYQMEDSTGEWTELKKITPVDEKHEAITDDNRIKLEQINEFRILQDKAPNSYDGEHTFNNLNTGETFNFKFSKYNEIYKLHFDDKGLTYFKNNKKELVIMEKLKKNSFKMDSVNFFIAMKVFDISKESIEPKNAFVIDNKLNWDGKEVTFNIEGNTVQKEAIYKDKRNGSLLAEGSSDPGHTYPNLVKGLISSSFGVYNCDQIYRLESAVSLMPEYVDEATGDKIIEKHVTCVIDLNYNGSFSFGPNSIICDKNAKNVILLFTKNKKVYALSAENFAKLNVKKNGAVSFEMKEVTNQVKNAEDLKLYLENS